MSCQTCGPRRSDLDRVTLQGQTGEKLAISVEGLERAAADEPWDATWLLCTAEVDLGAFRGGVSAAFQRDDFEHFLSELNRLLSGQSASASFRTLEDQLALRVELGQTGQATVVGKLSEVASSKA